MGPWVPLWIIPQGNYRNEETPIITRTVTVLPWNSVGGTEFSWGPSSLLPCQGPDRSMKAVNKER